MALEKLSAALDRWRDVVDSMKAAGEKVKAERLAREAVQAEAAAKETPVEH